MKIIGIIPARMNSSRFPGKVLTDLGGKPMLCRVYEAAAGSGILDEVYVATDSSAVADVCVRESIPVLMTGSGHRNPTSRIQEAAGQVSADYYVMIGGDEPLLTSKDITLVTEYAIKVMEQSEADGSPFVVNAMAPVPSYEDVSDITNIKIVCNAAGDGLYASRGPVPYRKKNWDFTYKKFVSIGVYQKKALDFFVSVPPGQLEQIEEFDLLRFMENRKTVRFIEIPGGTRSVDTPEDLDIVRNLYLRRRQI